MSSEPSTSAVVLLTRLSRAAYRQIGEDQLGMRLKEFVALNMLRETPGMSQRDLGEHMYMDANNLVLLLNNIEAAGFAVRERDPEDRRRHVVHITKEGRSALVKAEAAMESVTSDVLAHLSPDERETLRGLLAKALAADAEPVLAPLK